MAVNTCERVAQSVTLAALAASGETPIASIPWRANCTVAVNTNGNPTVNGALVRIYGVTSGVRAEIGRGRVNAALLGAPNTENPDQRHFCARSRTGFACDSIEVTATYDVQNWNSVGGDAARPTNQPVTFAVDAWGYDGAAESFPICAQYSNQGNFGAGVVSALPTELHELVAQNPNAVDRWLWLVDATNVGLQPATPIIPPIYVPAQGNASLYLTRRPIRFYAGLSWWISSSAGAFAAFGGSGLNLFALYC